MVDTNSKLNLPKLGFGFLRLPMKDNDIDYDTLNVMVDIAMENGVNYFDTGYIYLDGDSERALKRTVVERYPREKYIVTDKMAVWVVDKEEDLDRIFNEQLERTGLAYFDYYFIHSIEEVHIAKIEQFNLWGWIAKKKEKGLIKHFGFSFHDTPECLDRMLREHPETEVVQLQLNYLDWDSPLICARENYEVAVKHNKPVIVMEPVGGGNLAKLKPELEEKMKNISPDMSIASWAVRFCLSLEGVSTVLSGMSTPEQVQDNIATTLGFKPFTKEEEQCLGEVTKALIASPAIKCTGCRYCMDSCPKNISIPSIISAYNSALIYDEKARAQNYYDGLLLTTGSAESCIECGNCEILCPQHLPIREILSEIGEFFKD